MYLTQACSFRDSRCSVQVNSHNSEIGYVLNTRIFTFSISIPFVNVYFKHLCLGPSHRRWPF